MVPLTQQEIDDFEPCVDSDCDDDVCAFARSLSAARGREKAVREALEKLASTADRLQATLPAGNAYERYRLLPLISAIRAARAALEGE